MRQKTFFFLTAEQSWASAKCKKTLAGILRASTAGCLYIDHVTHLYKIYKILAMILLNTHM